MNNCSSRLRRKIKTQAPLCPALTLPIQNRAFLPPLLRSVCTIKCAAFLCRVAENCESCLGIAMNCAICANFVQIDQPPECMNALGRMCGALSTDRTHPVAQRTMKTGGRNLTRQEQWRCAASVEAAGAAPGLRRGSLRDCALLLVPQRIRCRFDGGRSVIWRAL